LALGVSRGFGLAATTGRRVFVGGWRFSIIRLSANANATSINEKESFFIAFVLCQFVRFLAIRSFHGIPGG